MSLSAERQKDFQDIQALRQSLADREKEINRLNGVEPKAEPVHVEAHTVVMQAPGLEFIAHELEKLRLQNQELQKANHDMLTRLANQKSSKACTIL